MVGVRGFEPPTPASRTQCSTRLSHTPTVGTGRSATPRSEDAAYSDGRQTPQAPFSPIFRAPENCPLRGCCIRKRLGVSDRLRRATAQRIRRSAGEWCNGNTTVFGTVILGSSPSSPAIAFRPARKKTRPDWRRPARYCARHYVFAFRLWGSTTGTGRSGPQ